MLCTWSESRAVRYCHFNITIGLGDIAVVVVMVVVVVLIIVVIVVARNQDRILERLSYPFGSVRVCYGLFSHAWTHSFDSSSAMIFTVKWRAALYTIQIDILVMSLYEGIASIDLFTEYFHFNVMPCCFRCYSGVENSLSWPQWNDCIMHVWCIGIYYSRFVFREWDCYNGYVPIACVVNIWLYHWLLICRAMLDKIQLKSDWNRFGLTRCGRHLICNQHRIFHVWYSHLEGGGGVCYFFTTRFLQKSTG